MDVPEKVIVMFRPVGSAPLLKQTKFKISSSHRFQAITDFLRRQLKSSTMPTTTTTGTTTAPNQTAPELPPIYLYVNGSFAPAADEVVANLFACFAVEGTLIVNYSMTPAWG